MAAKPYAELARAPPLKDCRGDRQGSVVFSRRIIKYLQTGFFDGTFRHLRCGYVAEDEKCRPRYRSHEDRFPFVDEFRSRADCSEGMPSPQIHPSVFLIFQEAARPKRSNAPHRPSFQN